MSENDFSLAIMAHLNDVRYGIIFLTPLTASGTDYRKPSAAIRHTVHAFHSVLYFVMTTIISNWPWPFLATSLCYKQKSKYKLNFICKLKEQYEKHVLFGFSKQVHIHYIRNTSYISSYFQLNFLKLLNTFG
jgi:hypothetical protein